MFRALAGEQLRETEGDVLLQGEKPGLSVIDTREIRSKGGG